MTPRRLGCRRGNKGHRRAPVFLYFLYVLAALAHPHSEGGRQACITHSVAVAAASERDEGDPSSAACVLVQRRGVRKGNVRIQAAVDEERGHRQRGQQRRIVKVVRNGAADDLAAARERPGYERGGVLEHGVDEARERGLDD